MKKGIVLIMALIFALGLTSMAFAADEPKPGVPASALTPGDKYQMEEAKKPAAVKKGAKVEKPGPPASALTPGDKYQMEEAKKPATADKMKEKKPEAAPAAPAEKK